MGRKEANVRSRCRRQDDLRHRRLKEEVIDVRADLRSIDWGVVHGVNLVSVEELLAVI